MLWTVRELASTQRESVVVELTVEITNIQQASGLETVGQRVDNAVVVCRKHHLSELFNISSACCGALLTRDHRQAVAHSDQVRTIGGRTTSRLGVQLLLGKTERAGILAKHGNILPTQTLKTLTSNIAKRGGEIDEVDVVEELVHGNVGRHGLDVVSSRS